MSFHRRHIDNNQVITLYREGGINRVKDWYTKGADALVTESGLASLVTDLMGIIVTIQTFNHQSNSPNQ